MTPLEIVQARWQGNAHNAAAMTVPYFELVNLNVDLDAMPDVWGGLLCQPEGDNDITMGSQPWVLEHGIFVVGLFAKSGQGPAALDGAVAELKAAFHGWGSDGLEIKRVDGPLDIDPAAEGNWWRLALTMTYERKYRRNATGAGFGDRQGLAA